MDLVLIGFALGIPGSLIAAYCYDILKSMTTRRRIDIEGSWGEFIPGSKGRQFSFGRIYLDKRRRLYAFDGTNFLNNGSAYCHWTTVTSHVDREQGQYFYTFRATIDGKPECVYYGFGVVNLATDERGRLVPADGHYVSASIDGEGMSHSMIKAQGLKYARTVSGPAVVAWVREATPKTARSSRR